MRYHLIYSKYFKIKVFLLVILLYTIFSISIYGKEQKSNTILTESNTILTESNTILTESNTILTESNTILTESMINEGVILSTGLQMKKTLHDYYISKSITIDNLLINIGSIDMNIIKPTNVYYTSVPYVACYEISKTGSTLLWEKMFTDYGYGFFSDGVLQNNRLYLLGNYESDDNIIIPFICKYTLSGGCIYKKEYPGNDNTIATNILSWKNSFFITGETSATNLIVPLDKDRNRIAVFVAYIDKELTLSKINYFGNKGCNNLYNAIIIDDIIYLYMTVKGEGLYADIYEDEEKEIILTCNIYLELVDYKEQSFTGNTKLKNILNKAYIFEYLYGKPEINVYELTLHGSIKTTRKIITNDRNVIHNDYDVIAYSNLTDKVLLIVDDYIINDNSYRSFHFYNSYGVLQFEIKEERNNQIIQNVQYTNGSLIVIGYEINDFFTTVAQEYQIIKKTNNVTKINGLKTKVTNSINDTMPYGTYKGFVTYTLLGTTIKVEENIKIPLKCNINKNDVYDLGISLIFNGEGVLSGKNIESGYIINEVGNYTLEVNGKDENSIIRFEVSCLCQNKNNKEYQELIVSNKIEDINKPSIPETKISKAQIDNLSLLVENDNDTFIFGIVSGVLGIILGCILPIRKSSKCKTFWRKHNV